MKALRDRAAGDIGGRVGLAGSALLHGFVAVTFLVAGRQAVKRVPLPAYRVELVAAPRASSEAAATTSSEPAAAAPKPEAPKPAARTPAPLVRSAAPTPARAPTRTPTRPPAAASTSAPARAQPPAPAAAPSPQASPNTAAPSGSGTDAATIRTEGVEFPFPGYLRNLVAQVYRRWRPPEGNADLEAEVLFFVHRDGSMTGLQFVRRSGSFAFDLEAQGAVEAAARAGAFGTLPSGYGPDVLPVSFFFSPRSLQ